DWRRSDSPYADTSVRQSLRRLNVARIGRCSDRQVEASAQGLSETRERRPVPEQTPEPDERVFKTLTRTPPALQWSKSIRMWTHQVEGDLKILRQIRRRLRPPLIGQNRIQLIIVRRRRMGNASMS